MKHPVFSFSALFIPFFIDFSHFSDQAAYFLLFYSFNVFFSLRQASLPLHLPGLPFSLFLRAILRFSQFSTLFILFLCFFHLLLPFFSSFSPFAASLACFFAFSSIPYCICLFSAVFFLFSAHFYLFFYFLSIPLFLALFSPFFSFSSIFSFLLMSLFQARFFHVSHPSKCFT